MLRFIAKATRHAAATRLDGAHFEAGHHAEHLLHRGYAVERLLMAMSMEQHLVWRLLELQAPRRPRKELFQHERAACKTLGAFDQHRQLIAQGIKARRFQPDYGCAALDRRR